MEKNVGILTVFCTALVQQRLSKLGAINAHYTSDAFGYHMPLLVYVEKIDIRAP